MKCDGQWTAIMHLVLDNEASTEEKQILKEHLETCMQCQKHFAELEEVHVSLENSFKYKAPENFTVKVLEKLPDKKEQQQNQKLNWFRRYPFLTAASIFIILMASTVISQWNLQEDHQVTYTANGAKLIIDEETDTVIVPEDITVHGDLVVRNGNVKVDGTVQGNVTIIRGEYMASAGNVIGESEEIKKITEWVWYSIKNMFD